jgi:ferric-dicitrate binding protein FerR (iron transport regulator)
LILPDGTKVWLNAASSITYPAAFAGNTRNITMSGEAYFEVAHDKTKPFTVDINGEGAVEVLGTEFNINAYKDHGAINTTLVNGKVKAFGSAAGKQKATEALVLAPGQQAVLAMGSSISSHDRKLSLRTMEEADMVQVLAWKNGIFDLTGASFQTLMKEVERWYDVDVVFEGAVPDIKFKGKMDRAVKLSGVVRFMHDYGVDAQLDGQKLIIKGK